MIEVSKEQLRQAGFTQTPGLWEEVFPVPDMYMVRETGNGPTRVNLTMKQYGSSYIPHGAQDANEENITNFN
jgi:hypothetical protein